jgi:hypothetical protein
MHGRHYELRLTQVTEETILRLLTSHFDSQSANRDSRKVCDVWEKGSTYNSNALLSGTDSELSAKRAGDPISRARSCNPMETFLDSIGYKLISFLVSSWSVRGQDALPRLCRWDPGSAEDTLTFATVLLAVLPYLMNGRISECSRATWCGECDINGFGLIEPHECERYTWPTGGLDSLQFLSLERGFWPAAAYCECNNMYCVNIHLTLMSKVGNLDKILLLEDASGTL